MVMINLYYSEMMKHIIIIKEHPFDDARYAVRIDGGFPLNFLTFGDQESAILYFGSIAEREMKNCFRKISS